MAEEKRSIEISYKANLKDLVSKLKTLPNVTGTEAKKMVAELDRQLKQAEKAAKKAAEAQKKAAQASSKAFRGNARALSEIDSAATGASENLEGVADSAGEVDRGFMAVSLALGQVNPALGEAANMAADVAAVSEGLLLTIKNLNPIILAGAAAVGVLTLGFASYFDSVKKAREATIQMRAAQKDINQGHKELKLNLDDVTRKLQDQRLEFQLSTGQISELEFQLKQAELTGKDLFKGNVETQKENIKALEENLKLIRRVQSGDKAITDEEKTQLRNLQLTNTNIRDKINLLSKSLAQEAALAKLEDNIQEELKQQNRALEGLNQAREEHVDIAQQMIQNEDELASETERAAAAEQGKLDALEISVQRQEELNRLLTDFSDAEKVYHSRKELEEGLIKLKETDHEKSLRQIQERAESEFARLGELAIRSGDFESFKEASHQIEINRIEEIALLEEKLNNDRIKAAKEIGATLASSMESFSRATLEFLENTDRATEESIQKLFRLQQAAAVAEIAMTTASNINKAVGTGPAAPILIAAAVAAGAAQTAAVLSQQPPTLHMGGLAPDERTTVLTGEAVLDRTTTRRLGEEGVRRLQNDSMGSPEIIILQPFKHIDRYNRSARRRAGKRAGSAGY